MTQSNPTTLADELLKQNGKTSVDAELGRLRKIIDTENKRADRLARWTKRIWLMLGVLIVVQIVSTFVYTRLARADDPTRNNRYPPAVLSGTGGGTSTWSERSPILRTVGIILAAGWLVSAFLFPIVVIAALILTILTYMARRTVGMHELSASLASIEAQLRLLAVSSKTDKP